MKKLVWVSLIFVCIASCQSGNKEVNLGKYFEEFQVEGSFILFDQRKQDVITYNSERCNKQFSPASTFKITNTIIGVEEGILTDENYVFKWDNVESWNPAWNKDMTLKEAFRVSCLPCYIRMADEIGLEKYRPYLKTLDYGDQMLNVDDSLLNNKQIDFWITGQLRISHQEQIAFLEKLYDYKFPVSRKAMDITKSILIDEQRDGYTLSGKTGWTTDPVIQADVGWYVGYLEKGDDVYFFATNIESKNPLDSFGKARKEITLNILREVKLYPN
jgi:beta-lactamase class D